MRSVLLISADTALGESLRTLLQAQQAPLEQVNVASEGLRLTRLEARYAVLFDLNVGDARAFLAAWNADARLEEAVFFLVATVDRWRAEQAHWLDNPAVEGVLLPEMGLPLAARQVVFALERRRFQGLLTQSEKLACLGNVMAGVLHELKNPLNNLLGGLERLLLRVDTDDPSIMRWGGMIKRNGELLRESLRQLLSGLRDGEEFEPLDVHRVLDRASEYALKGDISFRSITLVREYAASDPMIRGASGHLLHLWLNLIVNARQAIGRDSGRIVLRTSRDEQLFWVEVVDNGPGISPEVLSRLFEPFLTTKQNGSGIGLTLCKKIVEAHGGSIDAENLPMGGAVFRVKLPVAGPNSASTMPVHSSY